jgi:hypothetical protein
MAQAPEVEKRCDLFAKDFEEFLELLGAMKNERQPYISWTTLYLNGRSHELFEFTGNCSVICARGVLWFWIDDFPFWFWGWWTCSRC